MNRAYLLNNIDIFAQLSGEDRRSIAGLMKELSVIGDTILFRQGDRGQALYYVLSGQLNGTAIDGDGDERLVANYCQGQCFGEMGLLIGEKSPLTVRAVADSRLLVLEKDEFDDFLGQNVPAMLQMMKVITQRKAESKRQPVVHAEQPAPRQPPVPQSPPVSQQPPAPQSQPVSRMPAPSPTLPDSSISPNTPPVHEINDVGQGVIPCRPQLLGAEGDKPLPYAGGAEGDKPLPYAGGAEGDKPLPYAGSQPPTIYQNGDTGADGIHQRYIEDVQDAPTTGGKVITIFSPKGGVGKSTVAINLAVAMARARRGDVALLDLSLTFGHVPLLLNLAPRSSLAAANPDALQRLDVQENMDHYLSLHPSSGLRVLAGAQKPEEGELVSAETVRMALHQLRRHFAYLVIDTGSQFTDPVLAALEASDKILVLCSPEMSILRDVRECQRIWDNVVRIPRDRVFYLMNNIFPFRTLSREQLEEALQQKLLTELPYGGDAVAKTALKGETLIEARSGSPLARSIQALATQLTAEGTKGEGNQERKRGFFR